MNKLYTTEGEELLKNNNIPWNTYPRPQLVRESFYNLNGSWDFAETENSEHPESFPEKIRVPFAPQSLLSGIARNIPEEHFLFYRKNFRLPEEMYGKRIILHIGAADQTAAVFLNKKCIGEHESGYESFSFDITDEVSEENELVIRVFDHLSEKRLPYGKQSAKRGGMWYTPVSGIWQTVWIEAVPENYIRSLSIETGMDFATIRTEGIDEGKIFLGEEVYPIKNGETTIHFDEPHLWSPEDPYLYFFRIEAGEDKIQSYFALRSLSVKKINGKMRLCLNEKPYFFHGVLDQGYFSDGIFTPADPVLFEKDILAMKKLGFNTIRKHIKIEHEQFYYDCDRLGMIVFQDMVNNGDYNFIRDTALPTIGFKKRNDRRMHKDKETRAAFIRGMESTVLQLKNHPCICYWTIFNEGWGQFDSENMYHLLKKLDSSRFIGTYSGWFKGAKSDTESEHCYFKPFRMKKSEKPIVLTEFGGYAMRPEGHIFNTENEYGYKHFDTREEFVSALVSLYEKEIIPAVKEGLCAAILTQLSDVEDETNGLLSYDRKVEKVLPEEFLSVSEKLAHANDSISPFML